MKDNPFIKLGALGQSIWLDFIRNDMIVSGELRELIEEDGLRGLTSNPSVFEKAITESHIYDRDIRDLALEKKNAEGIYETLSQRDIQKAADEFRRLYEMTNGKDGYVSLEINPHLAYDTSGTIEEARRLWTALDRPNVFIEVPATDQGLPAIQQLISEGINVNATLIFGLPRYKQVINSYISGITARMDQGNPLRNVTSVASFFLSRKDSVIDPIEEEFVALGGEQAHFATNIRGQVAISSAKVAYQIYKQTFESEQFGKLAEKGAMPQRLMWASTSHEIPESGDIRYIETLIGPGTINAITPEMLTLYRKHGKPAPRLEDDLERAHWVLSELLEVGIDIKKIISKLEDDGIAEYIKSFDKLMDYIAKKSLVHDVMTEKN
jgi:transaldolase